MPDAQRIVIRIKKGKDGRTALSCTRADGTTTWQRQLGGQAVFFPKHDLTHCAVESTLGLRKGFYGLVSAGWDFSDFGSPWPRGKIPPEANISEMIVGFFDLERRIGERGIAADLNQQLAEYCMGTATLTAPEQVTDTFPINGTDFIEFYVGNAKQAAHFYRNVFGYKILAYRGPETGTRDRASYILEQGKVRLVLTTALRPDSEIATHVHKHGDGVKDIALWVDDARKAFRLAVERGA